MFKKNIKIFLGITIIVFSILLILNISHKEKFGREQNKKEMKYYYPNRIDFGELNDAPLAFPKSKNSIDFLAHWYNDFGLESTASSPTQAKGAYVWYDWSWNHSGNLNYDSSRHPLLGWYKGDDPKVLDWISYWLVKYGVNGVILSTAIDTTKWSEPTDRNYWAYQLFNNVKNFNSLKYVLWLNGGDHKTKKEVANFQQDHIINDIVAKHQNIYTYNVNGKRYAMFFIWDMEGWRGTYDKYNGAEYSIERLKELSLKLKALNFDGISIIARNLSSDIFTDNIREQLKDDDIYLFSGEYSSMYAETRYDTYGNYVNHVQFPKEDYQVLNVLTASQSQAPHPSGWSTTGSTPELFEKLLQNAVYVTNKSKKPKIITLYNVSEWAEGGPSLQPNKRDRFKYLEAVKNVKKLD
ncbi:hypothetical protein [Mesobacillus foraminis]|uniref:Glycosyl hydrolase family 26 n=1 Tax=Mesobacillus foraminis TaxID=279826 RepID=A0A4R2BCN0_9BACI|nr:hypothetical protein [Mesobacillus foraminis]TCN24175.1 hypothetical protein EV146_108290 [Mesobacillus foraminis]